MELSIMEMLSGGMQDEAPAPLDEPTAREMLRDALDKLRENTGLQPGQIVRMKRGLESGIKDFRGGVAIFIGFLSAERRAEIASLVSDLSSGLPLGAIEFDCIIGSLSRDGGMREHVVPSRYFEPAPIGTPE